MIFCLKITMPTVTYFWSISMIIGIYIEKFMTLPALGIMGEVKYAKKIMFTKIFSSTPVHVCKKNLNAPLLKLWNPWPLGLGQSDYIDKMNKIFKNIFLYIYIYLRKLNEWLCCPWSFLPKFIGPGYGVQALGRGQSEPKYELNARLWSPFT